MAVKNSGFAWRRILRAILSGIGGNIVMLVFLMSFLHVSETIRFMPWVLAFNAALTGFGLPAKSGRQPALLKIISALGGMLCIMVTCGLFAGASVLLFGDLYLAARDIVFFLVIGLVCSEIGTLLAIKYYPA